ncbi:uncharacterized protein [Henckelia pumila]|uniref:uncharacterized protein n=1 Tax=Henckelia pumila TaxID=405737 RepID=UPI003C6E054C
MAPRRSLRRNPPPLTPPSTENPPPVVTPSNDQGSTGVDQFFATAAPMETLLKRFQSFRLPTLTGTENSVDCESWLDDVDQLFDSLNYTDDRRIRLVIHQLQGVAKNWWTTTKRANENRGTVVTWSLFKTEFYKRFFPVSYRKEKGAEFAILKQGNLIIEDYVSKFDSLLRFAPHIADNEEAKDDHFINGLNPEIFTLVNTGRPNNFADDMDQAKGAEAGFLMQRGNQLAPQQQQQRSFQFQSQQQSQYQYQPSQQSNQSQRVEGGNSVRNRRDQYRPKGKQFKKSGNSSSSSSGSRQFSSGQSSGFSGASCSKCGGRHPSDQCRGVFGSCNICQQPGHFARVCPQRVSDRAQNGSSS